MKSPGPQRCCRSSAWWRWELLSPRTIGERHIRAWRRFAIGDENAYHALAALSSYEIAEYARSADLPASLRAIDVVALVSSPRPALFLRIAAVVQVGDCARERNLWWKLELDDELEQHWRLVDAYARPELRALRNH